ncbi:MAG TPA: hypothetical protein VJN93_03915 [Candidatus Acidoferrum sp.]|nr:hypothetical protein [Candidatus Acidoferrum sp.]
MPEQARLDAPVPRTEMVPSGQTGHRTLLIIGLSVLVLSALRDVWHYGLFGAAFDPLLWLLGIPVYLLYRKSKNSITKRKLSHIKASEVLHVRKIPEESRGTAAASRWARLAIFLCVALASAILAAAVFVKGSPSFVEGLTEKLTKGSLELGLAAWALSEAIVGRWLTLKRTWIAAIALYGIVFVLMAVFLGKPLATRLGELNNEQAQLDRRFAESATGKSLLQPQSFASPQIAADALSEFERYAEATEKLNRQKETLVLQRDDPSYRGRWAAYFEATRAAASTTEELYRFAAEPSRQVHVENGVVIIADPDGYNKRIDAVNDAATKLREATAAFGQPVPKAQKEEK